MQLRVLTSTAALCAAGALTLPSAAPAMSCRTKPVVIKVSPIFGEAVRSATALVDGRIVLRRKATRITSVTLRNLRPGRRRIELRLASRHNTRTVTLKRAVTCA